MPDAEEMLNKCPLKLDRRLVLSNLTRSSPCSGSDHLLWWSDAPNGASALLLREEWR